MKDFNKVELAIGDECIFTQASNGFLMKGRIVKLTKTGVVLKQRENTTHTYTDGAGKLVTWVDKHETLVKNSEYQIMKLG